MAAPQRKSFSGITLVRSEPAGIVLVLLSGGSGRQETSGEERGIIPYTVSPLTGYSDEVK